MARRPACGRRKDLELNAATLGELERVRQQVLEHLLQALGIGDEAASERRIEIDVERKLPCFGLVAERPADRIEQVGERSSSASTVTVPDSIFDRSRMSLMRFSRSVPAP